MDKKRSNPKAILTTIYFALVGLLGLFYVGHGLLSSAILLALYYAVLTINTYFSVKLFSSLIDPRDVIQTIFDVILLVLYTMLAGNFANPMIFVFINTMLFVVATFKYSLLLNSVPHPRLLKRKILIDLSGILGNLVVLTGLYFNLIIPSLVFMSLGFVMVNLLLFFVWPLYRLDN